MKMLRIRCTSCGADFDNVEADQQIFRCTRKGCGAVFMVEQGRKFFDIEEMQAQHIQKLREGLKNSLTPFTAVQAKLYAGQILAMIPEDFRARAALVICEQANGHILPLRQLLEGEEKPKHLPAAVMQKLNDSAHRQLRQLLGDLEWKNEEV